MKSQSSGERTNCIAKVVLAGAECSRRAATYFSRYGHRPLRTARFMKLGRTQGFSKYTVVTSVAPGQKTPWVKKPPPFLLWIYTKEL